MEQERNETKSNIILVIDLTSLSWRYMWIVVWILPYVFKIYFLTKYWVYLRWYLFTEETEWRGSLLWWISLPCLTYSLCLEEFFVTWRRERKLKRKLRQNANVKISLVGSNNLFNLQRKKTINISRPAEFGATRRLEYNLDVASRLKVKKKKIPAGNTC